MRPELLCKVIYLGKSSNMANVVLCFLVRQVWRNVYNPVIPLMQDFPFYEVLLHAFKKNLHCKIFRGCFNNVYCSFAKYYCKWTLFIYKCFGCSLNNQNTCSLSDQFSSGWHYKLALVSFSVMRKDIADKSLSCFKM